METLLFPEWSHQQRAGFSFDQLPPIWGWKLFLGLPLQPAVGHFRSTPPNLGMETVIRYYFHKPALMNFRSTPPNLGMETFFLSVDAFFYLFNFRSTPPNLGMETWKLDERYLAEQQKNFRSTPPNLGMETGLGVSWRLLSWLINFRSTPPNLGMETMRSVINTKNYVQCLSINSPQSGDGNDFFISKH